jgi:2',3'-cyclic-nucleotide 2'-phosphodiesterase (5'-nucleotidase family)
LRDSASVAALCLLAACAGHRASVSRQTAPGVTRDAIRGEVAAEGPIDARVVQDDATLVVFYSGELDGSMDDCGCPGNPRGGLPRLKAYIDAERRANPGTPDLLLGGGYWLNDDVDLSGALRKDARARNVWMTRGLAAAGFTALNTSLFDLAGVAELGRAAADLPMVSANVRLTATGRSRPEPVGPRPWIAVNRGGIRVGVTGITQQGDALADTPDLEATDPTSGADAAIGELATRADVIVLLAFHVQDRARDLAERHPEVDVVVDTDQHRETSAPFRVGNAVWVKSAWKGERLGELRLWLQEGRVISALDRQVDLDPEIPGDLELFTLVDRARREIQASEREIFEP